ncbi:hypothetical protein HDU92_003384 [Lobulomyces angularis]|nr:hypothetical protein HDU92_003384 [Lobulomyces angularis]
MEKIFKQEFLNLIETTKNLFVFVFSRQENVRREKKELLGSDTVWVTKITLATASFGFASGVYVGGSQRATQFLAENAHRLPKLQAGWYFYHKHKQFEVIHAGMKGGMKYALKFGSIGLGFSLAETFCQKFLFKSFEKENSNLAWLNGLGGGVLAAFGFSLTNRLSPSYAKYAILYAAAGGLAIGGLQDIYGLIYGVSLKNNSKTLTYQEKGWFQFQ